MSNGIPFFLNQPDFPASAARYVLTVTCYNLVQAVREALVRAQFRPRGDWRGNERGVLLGIEASFSAQRGVYCHLVQIPERLSLLWGSGSICSSDYPPS